MQVLIAEHDRDIARLLQSRLKGWGYDPVVAENGRIAWELLQLPSPPRLTLLDWMMPEMDGPEVLENVRRLPPEPYRYIIMLTAKGGQDDIVQGLDCGADDYLAKPVDFQELKVRLRAGERIIHLQNQLTEARDALKFQATHDGLTGLWNRPAIMEALDRELARSRRQSFPVAVVMMDLDHFKQVNDTHGHPAGDEVLRQAAARLKRSTRTYDSVGRYGGEKFIVVLPGCDTVEAMGLTERLRAAIEAAPVEHEERNISITASLGCVIHEPGADPDPERLIKSADEALCRAKEEGRNRVIFA